MSQLGNATSGQNNHPQSARKDRQAARALTAKPVIPRGPGRKFPNLRISHSVRAPIRH